MPLKKQRTNRFARVGDATFQAGPTTKVSNVCGDVTIAIVYHYNKYMFFMRGIVPDVEEN